MTIVYLKKNIQYIGISILLLLALCTFRSIQGHEFTITTQNIMTNVRMDEQEKKRLQQLANRLFRTSPSCIGLQELASDLQFDILSSSAQDNYHIVRSQWHTLSPLPLRAYTPSLSTLSISLITFLLAYYLSGTSSSQILSFTFASLLSLLGIITEPHVFLKLAGYYTPLATNMDHMALALFLNKKDFAPPVLLQKKPFNNLGYTYSIFPSIIKHPYTTIINSLRTWIQLLSCRPGMLAITTKTTDGPTCCIINAHLATGITNSSRVDQVKEIQKIIEQQASDLCILCIDANETPSQPAITYLKKQQWMDAWKKANIHNNPGYTWSIDNPYVGSLNKFVAHNQRVDYIFIYPTQQLSEKIVYKGIRLGGKKKPDSDHYSVELSIKISKAKKISLLPPLIKN